MSIEQEIEPFVNTKEIVISSKEDIEKATLCIKGIKDMMKKVNDSYGPIIDKAHQSHKEAISQRDKFLKPLQSSEKKFKDAIIAYNNILEAEQRLIEAEANERLRKVAEEERKRLEEEAKASTNEWDKAVLEQKAKEVVAIKVEGVQKVIEQSGLSIRKTWKAKVINFDLIPRGYLSVDMVALNQCAKDEEVRIKVIPGVEFFQETSTMVR